ANRQAFFRFLGTTRSAIKRRALLTYRGAIEAVEKVCGRASGGESQAADWGVVGPAAGNRRGILRASRWDDVCSLSVGASGGGLMIIHKWEMRRVGEPLALRAVRAGALSGADVAVQVTGCALCYLDLAYLTGAATAKRPAPWTLGHEISGCVVAAGPEAMEWI